MPEVNRLKAEKMSQPAEDDDASAFDSPALCCIPDVIGFYDATVAAAGFFRQSLARCPLHLQM